MHLYKMPIHSSPKLLYDYEYNKKNNQLEGEVIGKVIHQM